MNPSRFKYEHLLYAAAFILALAVRLAGAQATPLSDRESVLALQALARGESAPILIGPHPGYLALTTGLMFIFQSGNWVARFWPALAGSLLVLLPAFFRGNLGRLPAVLMAFFLALDPGLLAVSRTADGPAMAMFFTVLAFGLWIQRKYTAAGLSAGMALLCGPQVWPGLLGLGAAVWIAGRQNRPTEITRAPATDAFQSSFGAEPDAAEPVPMDERSANTPGWQRALIAAVAVVFFVGTLFFTIPEGLSAIADSLLTYLRGWAPQAGASVPVGLLLAALLIYELFPLVFGFWGAANGLLRRGSTGFVFLSRNSIDRFLLVWWLAALILALLYPARQVESLAWSLLPLWGLASRQVARLVTPPAYDRLTMVGQMVLSAVILGYISMSLGSYANGLMTNTLEYRLRMGAALVMLVASTGLIAWGWSRAVALRGLMWGAGLILLFYMISAGWNAIGLSGRTGDELWRGEPGVYGTDLLSTIHDFKQWSGSEVGGPELVVVGVPSPALQWQLRDFERVSYTSQLPADSSPALVITAGQPDLALAATYRGQNFNLFETVDWNQFRLVDWLRWLVFRSAPAQSIQLKPVILWARVDLFQDAEQADPTEENLNSQVPLQ